MKKIFLAFVFIPLSVVVCLAQSVVINKVHNATDAFEGYSDAIELLVIEDHLDMRGLIIKDLSLNVADKDAGGKYKFNDMDFWKDMRSGTTIVLRRPVDATETYTQDLDASNYKLDLMLPKFTSGSAYFTVLQADPGGQLFNISQNDIVIIKRDDHSTNGTGVNQAIHAFAIGNSNTSTQFLELQAAGVPILYATGTTGTGYFQYPQNPAKAITDYNGAKATSSNAGSDLGWGTGLGQNNIDYIKSLRTVFFIEAPTQLSGFYPDGTSLTLNWADHSDNETGFEVERSTDGTTFTSLATVSANIKTYTVTGVSQSQTTYYRVRALNPSGNSVYTNVFNTSAIKPPSVVVNKIYNATSEFQGHSDAVELLVIEDHLDMRGLIVKDISLPDANKDAGGRYRFNNIDFWKDIRSGTTIVLRRPASASATIPQDIDGSDYTLELLLPNTTSGSAYFTVMQTNTGGEYFNISANDIVIIKKDDNTPQGRGFNQSIHAFAMGNSNTSSQYDELMATGVPILYATGTTGTGYFQYPSNPDQNVSDYKGTKAVSTNVGANLGWGVGFGQNNIDYIESLRKRSKSPSQLLAEVVSLTAIRLSWTDNTPNETGFEIERSTDGINFSLLATSAPNAVTFTDEATVSGTQYYYRIRTAIGTYLSYYSNTATVVAGAGIITDLKFIPVDLFENQAVGTAAGNLSADSPDQASLMTYTLVSGTDSDDNARFKIAGNQLQTNVSLDFEAQSSYKVRVRATSQSNYTFENTFVVSVLDVNEAPAITAIGPQNTCIGSEEKLITLSGINAGPENGQTIVSATVTANDPSLFEYLNASLLPDGKGEIRYKLKNAVAGNSGLSLTLKDSGETANGGVDTSVESFDLIINDFPVITITSDKGNTIDKGMVLKLSATGGVSYQWENAEGIIGVTNTSGLTVRPAQTTSYKVTATNAGGCSTVQEFTVNINENYDLVVASNLLSPNGDGLNDVWKIENIDLYPNNEVKVFDKSGRIIFSKKGYNNDWDGRIAGSSLNEDTYYYIIDFGPGQPKKKGFITMLNN
jgi:gliding motility-associated-like protein